MFCFFRKKPKTYYGLDVGNGAIKLVELQQQPKSNELALSRYLVRQTPPDTVENGVVKHRERLTGILRGIASEFGVRKLPVATVLTGQSLIVRQVEVPKMTTSELEKMLQLQADSYFGMPADRLSIDFQIVKELPSGKLLVFLVGSPKQPILEFAAVLGESGITVSRVDIEPMAALRSLRNTGALDTGRSDETTVVLDLGAGTSNLSIFRGDLLQMVRVITVAGNDLTKSIASNLNISFAEAETLKRKHGVLSASPIYDAMQVPFERLLRQVAVTLEFFQVENRHTPVTQMRIIGGNAKLQGLIPALAERVTETFQRINVTPPDIALGNPCTMIPCASRLEDAGEMGPILAVAIGLALGEVEANASS